MSKQRKQLFDSITGAEIQQGEAYLRIAVKADVICDGRMIFDPETLKKVDLCAPVIIKKETLEMSALRARLDLREHSGAPVLPLVTITGATPMHIEVSAPIPVEKEPIPVEKEVTVS